LPRIASAYQKGKRMTRHILFLGLTIGIVIHSPVAMATGQTRDSTVHGLVPPDSRPCAFFTLDGVAEADPVSPGNPWFALPQSAAGYKEAYSLLLAAALSGKTVRVFTTGATISTCSGYVGVVNVIFPPAP